MGDELRAGVHGRKWVTPIRPVIPPLVPMRPERAERFTPGLLCYLKERALKDRSGQLRCHGAGHSTVSARPVERDRNFCAFLARQLPTPGAHGRTRRQEQHTQQKYG